VAVSYFTAVIARHARGWRVLDVDLDEAEDLDDLADLVRGASPGPGPAVAVIEREDAWFALVRVDDESDPRVFVSDLAAGLASRYAEVLAAAADVDVPEDLGALDAGVVAAVYAPGAANDDDEDDDADDDGDDDSDDDDEPGLEGDEPDAAAVPRGLPALPLTDLVELDDEPVRVIRAWAGEPGLLDDLGLPAAALVALAVEEPDDPAAALAGIGEACGFDEYLDSLR
jgi:putative tRNA adenosine deaminase-associated protein